jgi:hypothetical protein
MYGPRRASFAKRFGWSIDQTSHCAITDRRAVVEKEGLEGMRLEVAQMAAGLEAAMTLMRQAWSRWGGHPMSMAACLLVVFLMLTWGRVQLADRSRKLGHDVEV